VRAVPETEAEFGVVMAVSPRHLHWAKGACASVRYFMDDTPICLLLDGEADVRIFQRTYGVSIVRRADIERAEPGTFRFGSTRAKHAALWYAPFETYLLLDADTVVWGDLRTHARFDRSDFILDRPIGDPELVRLYVCDPELVGADLPGEHVRENSTRYVNTGAYFGRREILERERYLELLAYQRAHPGAFFADQGLFNLLVFGAEHDGLVRVEQRELQVLTGHTAYEDVAERFVFDRGQPRVEGDAVVLHWAGSPKPRVRQGSRDHFEPMTFFRREFRAASRGGAHRRADDLWLRWEDATCSDFRGSNVRGRAVRWRRSATRGYRESKRAARALTPDRLVEMVRRRRPREG
jgi:hypothetical protein